MHLWSRSPASKRPPNYQSRVGQANTREFSEKIHTMGILCLIADIDEIGIKCDPTGVGLRQIVHLIATFWLDFVEIRMVVFSLLSKT